MSIKFTAVQCEICPATSNPSEQGAQTAREQAQIAGWSYVEGHDFCPDCTTAIYTQHVLFTNQNTQH